MLIVNPPSYHLCLLVDRGTGFGNDAKLTSIRNMQAFRTFKRVPSLATWGDRAAYDMSHLPPSQNELELVGTHRQIHMAAGVRTFS